MSDCARCNHAALMHMIDGSALSYCRVPGCMCPIWIAAGDNGSPSRSRRTAAGGTATKQRVRQQSPRTTHDASQQARPHAATSNPSAPPAKPKPKPRKAALQRAGRASRSAARGTGRAVATVGMDARQVVATVARTTAWATANGYRQVKWDTYESPGANLLGIQRPKGRKPRCKKPQPLSKDLRRRWGWTLATFAGVVAVFAFAAPVTAAIVAGGGYTAATAWRSRRGAPSRRARRVFAAEIKVASHVRRQADGTIQQVRAHTRRQKVTAP